MASIGTHHCSLVCQRARGPQMMRSGGSTKGCDRVLDPLTAKKSDPVSSHRSFPTRRLKPGVGGFLQLRKIPVRPRPLSARMKSLQAQCRPAHGVELIWNVVCLVLRGQCCALVPNGFLASSFEHNCCRHVRPGLPSRIKILTPFHSPFFCSCIFFRHEHWTCDVWTGLKTGLGQLLTNKRVLGITHIGETLAAIRELTNEGLFARVSSTVDIQSALLSKLFATLRVCAGIRLFAGVNTLVPQQVGFACE